MANKAQIYCCNSLGRWQRGEESFCPVPILVGVGVVFQQGDHSAQPPDSNPCTHSDPLWLRAKTFSCKTTKISSQWNCSRGLSWDWGTCLDGNGKATCLRAPHTHHVDLEGLVGCKSLPGDLVWLQPQPWQMLLKPGICRRWRVLACTAQVRNCPTSVPQYPFLLYHDYFCFICT